MFSKMSMFQEREELSPKVNIHPHELAKAFPFAFCESREDDFDGQCRNPDITKNIRKIRAGRIEYLNKAPVVSSQGLISTGFCLQR